jgi:hypothetical protein
MSSLRILDSEPSGEAVTGGPDLLLVPVFMYKMLTGRNPARASALRLTRATLVISAGMGLTSVNR